MTKGRDARRSVSFVVPAHDEARLIGATLDALHGAATALDLDYEIVVVDDASGDANATVACQHGARVLRVEHRQIAATRNAGARAARHDTLVFVDADTLVDARVLDAALRALQDGAVGGGAAVDFTGPLSPHERALAALARRTFRRTGIAPGCFVFCTRAAFEAADGFDETWYAGEDVAISRALAKQGRFLILREAVRTSERKLRTDGARDHLRLLCRTARRAQGSGRGTRIAAEEVKPMGWGKRANPETVARHARVRRLTPPVARSWERRKPRTNPSQPAIATSVAPTSRLRDQVPTEAMPSSAAGSPDVLRGRCEPLRYAFDGTPALRPAHARPCRTALRPGGAPR